jgi:hypothetical protein
MPLGCMSWAVGLKIGSSMSHVKDMDVAEDDVEWGRYLRLRVDINLYQPLDRGRVLLLTRKSCRVSFKYEKLPMLYFKCGRILHEQTGCPVKESKKQSHMERVMAWGSWLGAKELPGAPGPTDGPNAT